MRARAHTRKQTIKWGFQISTSNQNWQGKLSKLQALICGPIASHLTTSMQCAPRWRAARIYLPWLTSFWTLAVQLVAWYQVKDHSNMKITTLRKKQLDLCRTYMNKTKTKSLELKVQHRSGWNDLIL